MTPERQEIIRARAKMDTANYITAGAGRELADLLQIDVLNLLDELYPPAAPPQVPPSAGEVQVPAVNLSDREGVADLITRAMVTNPLKLSVRPSVQVRIAVVVDDGKSVGASPVNRLSESDRAAFDRVEYRFMPSEYKDRARYIVTANLPLPSVVEVAGVVEAQE